MADFDFNYHSGSGKTFVFEAVAAELDNRDIQYRPYERRLKRRHNDSDTYPGFEFRFESADVQATVFPFDGIRQSPLSPVDGRPMDRADENRVRALVE